MSHRHRADTKPEASCPSLLGRVSPVCCKAVGTEDKIYESRSLLLLVLAGGAHSCSLVLNDLSDFVSNELSAFVRAGSLESEAHGFLLLD